jgi:hypothetical protein
MKIRYIILVFVVVLTTACTESFLEREPKSSLNTDGALSRYKDMQVAVAGAYNVLTDEEYYARNFIVTGDVASDNIKVSPTNSGRFLVEYQFSSIASSQNPEDMWTFCYDLINRVNNVIVNIDKVEDGTAEEMDQLLGEAIALRALAHFDLVRYFAQPFNLSDNSIAAGANGAGGHLGVPYMFEPEVGKPSRETVALNYQHIISDLRRAASLMSVHPSEPIYMSSLAAEALLARAYLYTEKWDSASFFATKVISSGKYSLVSNANYIPMWLAEGSSETIFEVKFRADDFPQTNALGYIFLESGYGDLVATQDILDLFDANDVRGTGKDGSLSAASKNNGMFYTVNGQLYINKYPGRDGTGGLDNVKVIRLAEMYLIRAEALNKRGYDTEARADVDVIRQRANPSASPVAGAGSSLLEEILLERRLELAFEGHRYFDLIRNKKSIVRDDHVLVNGTTSYPNQRFCFPIPQVEIDANENMAQNPAYE